MYKDRDLDDDDDDDSIHRIEITSIWQNYLHHCDIIFLPIVHCSSKSLVFVKENCMSLLLTTESIVKVTSNVKKQDPQTKWKNIMFLLIKKIIVILVLT